MDESQWLISLALMEKQVKRTLEPELAMESAEEFIHHNSPYS